MRAHQEYIQTLETSLQEEMSRHAPLYGAGLDLLSASELQTLARIHSEGLDEIGALLSRKQQEQKKLELGLSAQDPIGANRGLINPLHYGPSSLSQQHPQTSGMSSTLPSTLMNGFQHYAASRPTALNNLVSGQPQASNSASSFDNGQHLLSQHHFNPAYPNTSVGTNLRERNFPTNYQNSSSNLPWFRRQ